MDVNHALLGVLVSLGRPLLGVINKSSLITGTVTMDREMLLSIGIHNLIRNTDGHLMEWICFSGWRFFDSSLVCRRGPLEWSLYTAGISFNSIVFSAFSRMKRVERTSLQLHMATQEEEEEWYIE